MSTCFTQQLQYEFNHLNQSECFSVGLIRHPVFVSAGFGGIMVLPVDEFHIGVSKQRVARWVDGNANILIHPGP